MDKGIEIKEKLPIRSLGMVSAHTRKTHLTYLRSPGMFGMKKDSWHKTDIALFLQRYKAEDRIRGNLEHYPESNYKKAERKFLQYVIEQGIIESEEEHLVT